MGKIIAIANQKGGVGKTTTSINLGVGLSKLGKKVLLIDVDPQGHLSLGLGIDKNTRVTLKNMLENVILGMEFDQMEAIINHQEGVDIIPANNLLAGIDISLNSVEDRDSVLKEYIDILKDKYDFIILDCMPALGMLTINCLAAADSVLIPLQTEYYAVDGLQKLLRSISNVKKRMNPNLEIEGILYTIDNLRYTDCKQIKNQVESAYGSHIRIFKQSIPNLVELSNTPSKGISIFEYTHRGFSREGRGADSYLNLSREVAEYEKGK